MIERDRSEVTDSIRDKAKLILENSRDLLTLDYNSIREVLAPRLAEFRKEFSNAPKEGQIKNTLERDLGATVFFDVVNFCFKDPSNGHEYEFSKNGKVTKRSSGLFTAMKEADVDWNSTIAVAALSPEKWKNITQLSPNNSLYLGEERGIRIRGFAKMLCDKGFLTVTKFIGSTDLDSDKLLDFLAKSGYFNDEFLKRAQLTIRMVNDLFRDYGLGNLKNIEKLTAMADYRLPQVFYNLGSVNLSEGLFKHLSSEEPIISDSRQERALRATVVVIGEEVSKIMGITEGNTDMLLWTLSQKMAKSGELPIPHMIVATDKY